MEDDGVVDAVQELGSEVRLEGVVDFGLHPLVTNGLVGLGESQVGLSQVGRTEVGRHDEDCVAEVDAAALRVGQSTLLQDLEQRVEDIRVGLLNLVEQHHGEWATTHRLGELPAFLVAHVAGR